MQEIVAVSNLLALPEHILAAHLKVARKASLWAIILVGVGLDWAAGTSQVSSRSLFIHLDPRSLLEVIHLGLIVHLKVRCLIQ